MAVKKKAKVAKKKTRPVAKKKAANKKVVNKTSVKKTAKKVALPASKSAPLSLEVVGEMVHYFPHVSAGVIKLSKELKAGDMIRIKGHTTDFKQTVDSMQIEHVPVNEAKKGAEIGLKVKDRVRIGDIVYKL